MKNVKRIVSQNLIKLRKESGLTQAELAGMINYSDKAVSRWETGEVIPDLETIYSLSEIFGVPVSSITEKQDEEEENEDAAPRASQKILSQIFLVCEIWLVLCTVFVYLRLSQHMSVWQLFVWGVPATALFLWIYNRKSRSNTLVFVCSTLFTWSFIACVYTLLRESRPWYVFFIGLPLQGLLVVRYIFNYRQNLKKVKLTKKDDAGRTRRKKAR